MIILKESVKVFCPYCEGEGECWQEQDHTAKALWLQCAKCDGVGYFLGHRHPMGMISEGVQMSIYLIEDFGNFGKIKIVENTLRAMVGIHCEPIASLSDLNNTKSDLPIQCEWSPWVHLSTLSESDFENDIWLTIQNYKLDQTAVAQFWKYKKR